MATDSADFFGIVAGLDLNFDQPDPAYLPEVVVAGRRLKIDQVAGELLVKSLCETEDVFAAEGGWSEWEMLDALGKMIEHPSSPIATGTPVVLQGDSLLSVVELAREGISLEYPCVLSDDHTLAGRLLAVTYGSCFYAEPETIRTYNADNGVDEPVKVKELERGLSLVRQSGLLLDEVRVVLNDRPNTPLDFLPTMVVPLGASAVRVYRAIPMS